MHLPNGDVFPFGTCHIIIAAGAESGHIANLAGMGVGKVIFFLSKQKKMYFLNFPACFSIPNFFSNLNYNCSNFVDLRNLQEQVKKAFCYQKLF